MFRIALYCPALLLLMAGITFAADYKGPNSLVASPDGKLLYVLNYDSAEIAVVSLENNAVLKTIPVPAQPSGMALCTTAENMFVTCGSDAGKIVVVNLASGEILKEVAAGHSPCAPVVVPSAQKLFVCNRFGKDTAGNTAGNVGVYEIPSLKLIQTIPVIREPIAAAVTPDGKTVFVNNFLPNDPSDSFDVASEVSAIDVAGGEVKNIRLPNGTSSLHGICVSPDGKYVYAVGILARYALPTTQVERGWMNTNALNIIDVDSKSWVNTVLLDDVDLGAANPWDVTTSKDGKKVFVAVAGTHELCVINTEKMLQKIFSLPKTIEEAKAAGTYDTRGTYSSSISSDIQNDLAFLVEIKKRIKLPGKAPRSVVNVDDHVYLGMYFSDTVVDVDLYAPGKPKTTEIALGPAPEMSAARKGELAWHDASLCMQHWQCCASCHPDARMDGLNWDLLNDGMGNPKNAKSMLYAQRSVPAMWQGVRASAFYAIRTGFRFIQFSVPDEEICTNIEEYFKSLKPEKSPYLVDGELSESAKRGKMIFENEKIGCTACHPGPDFTDRKGHDVGTRNPYDKTDIFYSPTLCECWRTGPYLHDGRYKTMKEVFTIGKHGDAFGADIESLSDQEISDLAEYILSL